MNNIQFLTNAGGHIIKTNDNHTIANSYLVRLPLCAINKAVYFIISDKLLSNENLYAYKIVYNYTQNHDTINVGLDNFNIGVDYFLGDSFINGVDSLKIPEYLTSAGDINTAYYKDITNTNNKDLTNINYFYKANNAWTYTYSEDELDNFRNTFFNIILNEYDSDNVSSTTLNSIYKLVCQYWASGTDNTETVLSLLLGTEYSATTYSISTCGCTNSSTSDESETTTELSCSEKYVNAMSEWLTSMMGNVDWYCEWYHTSIENSEYNIPNESLLNSLIKLFEDFLSSGYDLSFSSSTTSHCNCPTTDDGSTSASSCSNESIMRNFLQALKWIKDGELSEHSNTISIYGSQFASLIQKLIF